MADDQLAVNGGDPVREDPFPGRDLFGLADAQQLLEALAGGTLFFPSGTKVYEFQAAFAAMYDVGHVITSTSGTSAIHVALGAINPEPGDEVITTPISDMGTVAPIVSCNCIPVFADVKLDTYNLDPDDIERKITERTAAIIVVHCWGRPAQMDRIMDIAQEHAIPVIEDCSQAHWIHYRGRLVGTIGALGAFSLQDSKHLQCGDGGVTITDDNQFGHRAALFVDKGCLWSEDRKNRFKYEFMAPCYRMTELQGAILNSQLPRLKDIVRRRMELGDRLAKLLAGIRDVHPPTRPEDIEHGYWNFPMRVDEKALGLEDGAFARALHAEGIPTGKWIGKPLYLYDALRDKNAFGTSQYPWEITERGRQMQYEPGLCPVAETALKQLHTLPINERMTEEDLQDIARAVRKVAALITC